MIDSRTPEARQRHARTAMVSALLLLSAGCAGSDAAEQQRLERAAAGSGDVVVAVAWPWRAHRELLFREGIDLALEDINGNGGVHGRTLRIIAEDDEQSVNSGRLVAQRIVHNADVVAVIGHLQSYVTIPAAAIYDMAGLPQLAPAATDPDLTARGYERLFRTTLTDHAIGSQLADHAWRSGYQRVAIYYARAAYGRTLANAFDERAAAIGLQIVARNSYDPAQDEDTDFAPLFNDWGRLDLDAIFLAGEVPLAGRIIAALRRAGITAPVIGGDAMNSPGLIAAGGAAAEGTVVAAHFHHDAPGSQSAEFTRRFRARFGLDPAPGAALGYDALRLLAHAMQRAPALLPEDIAEALRSTRAWPGVTGPFTFGPGGDLIDRRMQLVIVRKGKFVYLDADTPTAVTMR